MGKFVAITTAPHAVAQIGLHPCLQPPQTQAYPAQATRTLFAVTVGVYHRGRMGSVQKQQVATNESKFKNEIKSLKTSLATLATNESKFKNEIEVLKTFLAHALSSEREMRTSVRDTREEWERVQRALREEISVLRSELGNMEKELTKVKKELKGQVVPFVQRFIQGRSRLVEEMITLEEPPQTAPAEAEMEEECVLPFQASYRLRLRD